MSVSEFFKRQITVAKVYGIPVRIDYRWFGIVALCVWLISSNLQNNIIQLGAVGLPPLDPFTAWSLAFITTAGLFISVFGHELSHALMARAEGIEIEEIVLHPFGGLARMRSEPESPRAEFRIAVAGPAASFLFALLAFGGAKIAALGGYWATVVVFFFIAWGNLLLAVFNLLPGYPLDGGRVLRAILWRKTNNITHATRMAGFCGVIIAGTLILFGVYIMIAPNWRASRPYFMGAWSILVGLFLLDTAYRVVKGAHNTRGLTVGEAMTSPVTIRPDTSVRKLIDEVLPMHRQTAFPVALDHRLHGIVALEDLRTLPRDRWRLTLARDVMRPVDPNLFVEPSTTLVYARDLMKRNGVGSLAVVNNNGELVGFIQRGKIKRHG
ncbi:MAG TPA: site-2 protease family protein [Pyrinomonadaceae bacterium]|nr:site-2 protease family protein [Pyrinomonadaceae bacterium]